jgi:hypothetical protein
MLKLPPGKYYIGDPCYVFNDDTWQRLLDGAPFEGAIVEFDGRQLWGQSTAHGDGVYLDQDGNEFGVDSGVLAAIPIELVDNPAGEEEGVIIDAPNGLVVEHDAGTFWLGEHCITTDDVQDSFPTDALDDLDGGYDGDLSSEFR